MPLFSFSTEAKAVRSTGGACHHRLGDRRTLIASGAADRTPNVSYTLSHGGGTITALAGRVFGAEASAQRLAATPALNSRLCHLRRFYYDTAISTSPIQIQALKSLVGSSQILFGTDYPFGSRRRRPVRPGSPGSGRTNFATSIETIFFGSSRASSAEENL